MRLRQLLSIAVMVTTSAGLARAQTAADAPPPKNRIVYRNLTVARVNPVGLVNDARVSYRRRLYEHDALALRDNFFSIGLAPMFSPGFARGGVIVEVQPLSVLQLWALYEGFAYFGNFDMVQSFPTARARYSDAVLDERSALPPGSPERNYPATGTQLVVGATLQAKVGPIAVRNQARMLRPDLRLRDGDTVFYDLIYDVLAPNRGWFATNDADVLYVTKFGLTAGLRWTATHAFHGARHLGGGDDGAPAPGTTHRAGPLIAYTFFQDDGARFNTPTVLLVANWWIQHPYRTGAEVSRAIPYVAAGFAFTGDLLK